MIRPSLLIAALRARCPVFADRVVGAAQFKVLTEATALDLPAAFVIPLDDQPQDDMAINDVRQSVRNSFGVVVAVSNVADEPGRTSTDAIWQIKRDLFAALLGWRPTDEHNGITYEGGTLVALDRARLWWQFEFGAEMQLGPEDGWQQTELGLLPGFETARLEAVLADGAPPVTVVVELPQ